MPTSASLQHAPAISTRLYLASRIRQDASLVQLWKASYSCCIGLASNRSRQLPIPNVDKAVAGIEPLPEVGPNQCGHWLRPIRLRLRDRIDSKHTSGEEAVWISNYYSILLMMCHPNGLALESNSARPNSPTCKGKPVLPNAGTIPSRSNMPFSVVILP